MRDQRDQHDVIVGGGGPADSTVSGLLSKWGRRALLPEKEKFPRYDIDESLVPGVLPAIDELGAAQVLEERLFLQSGQDHDSALRGPDGALESS